MFKKLKENEIQPMTIDLGVNRRGELNEFFLTAFGAQIKSLLGDMFGNSPIEAIIKGTRSEIQAFGNALNNEKKELPLIGKYKIVKF